QMALAQAVQETADALGVDRSALARWLTEENRLTRILYALVGGFSSAESVVENQTILREYVSFLDEQGERILRFGDGPPLPHRPADAAGPGGPGGSTAAGSEAPADAAPGTAGPVATDAASAAGSQ